MRQTSHVTGIRHARYRGLPKTALEHVAAATAVNLIRLDAYWTGRPLDRTRTSHSPGSTSPRQPDRSRRINQQGRHARQNIL
jgi:hypothetical protein